MSRKSLFYIIFFTVLFTVFYFILIKEIPGFGKKETPPLGNVEKFSFINQDGEKITEKNVAGKVFVVEYFFTTCKGICPRMNNNMKTVYEKFKNENDLFYLLISILPSRLIQVKWQMI